MRLIVNIDGDECEVSLRNEDGKLFADVSGREYELSAAEPEPGVRHFKLGDSVHEFTVLESGEGKYSVTTSGDEFSVRVADPRKLGAAAVSAAEADGVAEIRTQMPGKVVRVLVAEGDEVASGDGIIVVEAMKMQNEMRSPKEGQVRRLACAEGDTVNAGDLLAEIE